MSKPRLSVVMCAYNEEQYIMQAIDSILAQTYSDFELIIVDDASTDGTQGIIQRYEDKRILYIRNESNLGPYRSANKGIALASGELIARHDADDISLPDRFELQVDNLAKNPEIGLVSTDFQYIDHKGRLIESVNLPEDHDALVARLNKGNIFAQGALMFRKILFDQLGGYNKNITIAQDYDMWLRFSEVCRLINIQKPLFLVRFHGKSISRNKRDLQLAYQDFAWDQAQRRRSGQAEIPIPEDILSVYQPDPYKLFLDARGCAYLYFVSEDKQRAIDSLKRAYELQPLDQTNKKSWLDWALSRAILLANIRDDPKEGANFLIWFQSNCPPTLDHNLIQKEVGTFYAQQAFESYMKDDKKRVIKNSILAIKNDWNWVKNRGLIVLILKSVIS